MLAQVADKNNGDTFWDTLKLNSTQPASMDAGVKTPQCPHLSSHFCILRVTSVYQVLYEHEYSTIFFYLTAWLRLNCVYQKHNQNIDELRKHFVNRMQEIRSYWECYWSVAASADSVCQCKRRTFWTQQNKEARGLPVGEVEFGYDQSLRPKFLTNVNSCSRSQFAVARPSVVCNVREPYSGGLNFRQYFDGIRYLGHPLTSSKNFTMIVPGEHVRRGS